MRFLVLTSTLAAVALALAAAPLSQLLLSHRDTTTFLIAVLGLWSFTNLDSLTACCAWTSEFARTSRRR